MIERRIYKRQSILRRIKYDLFRAFSEQERVPHADSTPLRPDRSRPYPSAGVLPDQRPFHTGDGTPATSQSPSVFRHVSK